jgi:hypothetical protein
MLISSITLIARLVGGSWYRFLPRAVFARHGLYGTQGHANNNAGGVNDPASLSNDMG